MEAVQKRQTALPHSPQSVNQVARAMMYEANRVPNATVDNHDAAFGEKIASAIQKLAGTDAVDFDGVRGIVTKFSGKDGHVGKREFAALSQAIQGITQSINDPINRPNYPKLTFDESARFWMQWADVNHDARIDDRDRAQHSDFAELTQMILKEKSLTENSLKVAVKKMHSDQTPESNMYLFSTSMIYGLGFMRKESESIGDIARSQLSVFDDNQDLRLTNTDKRAAELTRKLAGVDVMRAVDIEESLLRWDTQDATGNPGQDGRLDKQEYRAYYVAWRNAGG